MLGQGQPPPHPWPPGVEHAEVDEGVGGHEEVAEEAADHVEVTDEDADEGDGEHEDVASDGVVVGAPAGGEGLGVFNPLQATSM